MASLKVGYLLKQYPRLSQTFILNEMLELERQGIDLTVVALKGGDEEIVQEECRNLRAPVCYLSVSQGNCPERDPLQAAAEEIAARIKGLGIDHLHAHFATWATEAALRVSDLTGVPFSFTAHARDIYHRKIEQARLAEKVERARFVVTVSDYNQEYLRTLASSEGRSGRIIRLYNGINLDQLFPMGAEKEPNLVVGVGRLVRKKGFHHLIEACKILKERGRSFHCAIVGEGEERKILEKSVAEQSLQKEVSLLGARPHSGVIQLIRRATLFVLPCVVGEDGDRDGLPTVLTESMAVGTPVISTPVAGIPEIVRHDETGLLAEANNPEGLADAITSLLDDPALRKRLRVSARALIEKEFDLAANVAMLKECFLSREGR